MLKKKKQYDVIIVGGGIGGLACGAYLARDGFRTLIVEKEHNCGGYPSLIKYEGYCVDRMPSVSHVTILEVLRELGINVPMQSLPPFRIYTNKQFLANVGLADWEQMAEVTGTPRAVAKKIVDLYDSIGRIDRSEIRSLKQVSLKSWVNPTLWAEIGDSILKDLMVRYLIMAPKDVESLSVGELASFYKSGGPSESRKAAPRMLPCDPKVGGLAAIPEALVRAYLDYGGELRTDATATEILIKDRHVTGVVFRYRSGLIEEALAPVVASDVPMWNLFNIIDEAYFEPNFVKNAKQLASFVTCSVTLSFGLNRLPRKRSDGQIDDFKCFTRLMLDDGRRVIGSYMIPSLVSPAIAPEGRNLLVCMRVVPPAATREWSSIKQIASEQMEVLSEIFVDLDEVSEWCNIITGNKISAKHALSTIPRSPVISADIQGLYFSGDTAETDEGRPWCLDLEAYNGRKAARLIKQGLRSEKVGA